jgi:hypothetical protein
MTSVESIREGFPFITIAKQPGLPTYETIAEVHLKLKANAASIVSELGGGAHGLLGLVLPPTTYATLTNHAFTAPINPGTTPNLVAGGTTAQISEAVRQHIEELRIWREHNATDKALQQQLINTFDEPYIRGLRNRHTGYNNVSAMQILTHLYTTYGVITPIDIEDNDAKMRAPFDPTQPIELLFDQIETAVEFADAGNRPYNPEQVVSRAYLLLMQTGLYADSCRDWRRRDVLEQTWPNFKTDFAAAHRDLRLIQTAAHGAGYQSANSAMEDLAAEYRRETSEALGHLATATAADRTAVANLTQANTSLSSQLNTANTTIDSLRALIETLQIQLRNLNPPASSRNRSNDNNNNNNGRHSNNTNNRNDNNRNQQNNSNGRNNNRNGGNHSPHETNQNNDNNTSYCHTHGRTRNDRHTSLNCRNPSNGHAATATLDNRMGGSEQWCADK